MDDKIGVVGGLGDKDLTKWLWVCVSRLEGREAGAKHRAEGEPVRWRPVAKRRGTP